LDFGLKAFSNRPATSSTTGVDGVSRFSRVEFPCMPGVSDCGSPADAGDSASVGVAFRLVERRQHPSRDYFAAQYPASLHVPLSTLRCQPYGWPRMTRGQDGSLLLSCVTLSFTTPRRFIPAHSTPLYVPDLIQESKLVRRQTGAPLGEESRLAAEVAASSRALSPNGCRGRRSRIARQGKRRRGG